MTARRRLRDLAGRSGLSAEAPKEAAVLFSDKGEVITGIMAGIRFLNKRRYDQRVARGLLGVDPKSSESCPHHRPNRSG